MTWFVYFLECADKSLYVGITTDLKRRLKEHNFSKRGAKYTRARKPVKLIYFKNFKNRSAALKEEYKIKLLSRKEKIKLINKN